ncbi:hypothetical protein [Klebsiella phage phiKp_21]|uniref:Uncharacterized protein n=1 Tax=Klebsiella phage vB_KleM_RaK2 TaxID=1147094 RepID=H6X3U0_9CAUD|nr:hypothetical protein F403_gp402 [Klebsiella phage vB_KleM_RaK2]YP_010843056.1 hypothetical protein ACQ27_gp172 [Klebsiella phage K64-1]QOE32545.1 hypothetical protein CPT_Muenster_373 [Klebsiella phage Muenster]UYL05021.1 hypothetical protein DIDNDMLP_00030 [Klebsiella phage KP13-7]BEH88142.1 hypothetical protein [Klebsiella phage phiKp_21]AFA44406.1 hypothetical protein RaK2_00133 [Klebsiella phage vB_KleM_RaK2]
MSYYSDDYEQNKKAKSEISDLLTDLYDIGFYDKNDIPPPVSTAPDYGYDYITEGVQGTYSLDENGIPVNVVQPTIPEQYYTEPVIQKPKNTKKWDLVEDHYPGTKSTKVYSIKCNSNDQIIMNNILMHEAALTLVNLLNEGRMLTDPKILGIISSGIQFTSVMNEVIKVSKERLVVLNEARYDDAKELDVKIAEKKNEAYKLKKRVLDFLKTEGYIK